MSPPTLALRALDLRCGAAVALLHPDDARRLGLHAGEGIRLVAGASIAATVQVTPLTPPGTVGLSVEASARFGAELPPAATATRVARTPGADALRAKVEGRTLAPAEVADVMADAGAGLLSGIELGAFIAAVQAHGMTLEETVACTRAMAEGGERLSWARGPVVDVHSIGGVPGNKYAPIAVAIVAEHGVLVPKTSSRAISSACGTADLIETVAPVALSGAQVRRVVEEAGAALCWGGGLALTPADGEIVRAQYPLRVDPPGLLVASVLAKKLAVGARHVLVDIPAGPGSKAADPAAAARLAESFRRVGSELGLQVECVQTDGSQPLGHAVGPALEMREVLHALEGRQVPEPLLSKSIAIAGRLLEMGGVAQAGEGAALARATLASGAALRRFDRIVRAQGGLGGVRSGDLRPGRLRHEVLAPADAVVEGIDNRAVVSLARAAGAPHDPDAGLMLHALRGDTVRAGAPILTLHARHEARLEEAVALAARLPFRLRRLQPA